MICQVLDVPADRYHADNLGIGRVSLSASIAKLLVLKTPAHAFAAHPRLNPDFVPDDDQKFDVGTVAHALLLEPDREASDVVEVVCADDWRTKAAKQARDEIRAVGRVPLLSKDWQRVQAVVAAAHEQLAGFDADPPVLADGRSERTLVWEMDGVACRARCDWLRNDFAAVDDLKTTTASADPERFARRTLFDLGYDVQAAFYLRGVHAVSGRDDAVFRFVVVETEPPYAVSVVALDPAARALAEDRVDHAVRVWRECLASGEWPSYPRRVAYASPPPWLETQWIEKTWDTREATA